MGARVGFAGGGTEIVKDARIPRQRRHTGRNAPAEAKDPSSPAIDAAADKRARKLARRAALTRKDSR
ncbi:hypothetical protein GCM10019059_44800 [Camelimonas fluminis]|nr:hypothetical protein GCM10019059_44800 [Camelimonas fluminis]